MNSRDRVFAALRHEEPDRVPYDFWATPEAARKLMDRYKLGSKDELLEHLDVDLQYIDGPGYIGPPLRTFGPDVEEDIWGVRRRTMTTGEGDKQGTYKMVAASPLAGISSVREAEAYDHWPSPDWYDYSVVEAQCRAVRDKGRVALFVGDRTNRVAQFKPYMYIRGMENAYMDMALNPELFEYIVHRIAGFYNEYLERILKAAGGLIDIFLTGDDFGGQKNTLCSLDMWRRFLRPGFKGFLDRIHGHGIKTMHHTCGFVVPLVEDFIECGLDILNPIQPGLPGQEKALLKKRFGGRISFHGGIGIQKNLPFGTPDAVKREVREAVSALSQGGGYILCTAHNIQADVPVENSAALFDAYREYGPYGMAR